MDKKKCVHTEHCCVEHGCKYCDSDCPVYLGYKKQSFTCEYCQGIFEDYDPDMLIPEVSLEELIRRRNGDTGHYCNG